MSALRPAQARILPAVVGGYLWMIGRLEDRKSLFVTHETLRGEQLRKLNLSTKLSEKPNNMVGAISGSR